MYRKTYVEINLDNIANNTKEIINKYNNYDYYIGVVKGNAYGHGMYIVNTLIQNGINYLAVSSLEEAKDIRKYNKKIPILCLEPINLDIVKEAIKLNVTLTVSSYEYLMHLNELVSSKVKIHIKVDSGMNRLGFKNKFELKSACDLIHKNKFLMLEGIYSHFATTGVCDKEWDNQVIKFKEITSLIDLNKIKIVHLFSSISLLAHKKIDMCNGVRIGTLLYGYNISPKETYDLKGRLRTIRNNYLVKKHNVSPTLKNVQLNLKSAIKMYTEIVEIKDIHYGEKIGYGSKITAYKDLKLAICPIGYADGIARENNNCYVVINNKKYQAIGEIDMCMMSIVVDDNVDINDRVTILGDGISLGVISRFKKVSIHEMLTNIGQQLPRLYIKNDKVECEVDYVTEANDKK